MAKYTIASGQQFGAVVNRFVNMGMHLPDSVVERGMGWFPTVRETVATQSQDAGLTRSQGSGIVAAVSPNVEFASRNIKALEQIQNVSPEGWVMIHRSFLNEKPEVSLSLIDVRQNYWLGVVLPTSKKTGDSRATLLQSNWSDVDYGILPIPESTALNLVVSSMKDSFDATETWMNGHYEKP